MFIPDPDPDFLPIPDRDVKKAPNPGSGSATLEINVFLLWLAVMNVILLRPLTARFDITYFLQGLFSSCGPCPRGWRVHSPEETSLCNQCNEEKRTDHSHINDAFIDFEGHFLLKGTGSRDRIKFFLTKKNTYGFNLRTSNGFQTLKMVL